ncbi:FAD binding domain-containing protein [Acrocarpospora macrocephala]|nr:xanthine dehydrogenase family protein subunit M [Acrocarpospora macrocephala]
MAPPRKGLTLILPSFRYLRPQSLEEAVSMLVDTDGAAVLAGGQTLINVLKLNLAAPTALVDIHRLPELRIIKPAEDGALVIGAAATYAQVAADPIVSSAQPSVAAMAAGLVDRQVRNRGTIGGNCCLNDPTNNFPPLLAALDARFRIAGPAGERVLDAADFFTGTMSTALTPDEILIAIEIPPLPGNARIAHRHLQIGADSWAVARAAVRLDIDAGIVTSARLVAGAVQNSPVRLHDIETTLTGRTADASLPLAALEAFDDTRIVTVDDVHCSAAYRKQMCKIQVRRALEEILAQGSRS